MERSSFEPVDVLCSKTTDLDATKSDELERFRDRRHHVPPRARRACESPSEDRYHRGGGSKHLRRSPNLRRTFEDAEADPENCNGTISFTDELDSIVPKK